MTVWNSVFCSFKESIKGPKATALIVDLTRQRLKSFGKKIHLSINIFLLFDRMATMAKIQLSGLIAW